MCSNSTVYVRIIGVAKEHIDGVGIDRRSNLIRYRCFPVQRCAIGVALSINLIAPMDGLKKC
jgi:hypothetical protein